MDLILQPANHGLVCTLHDGRNWLVYMHMFDQHHVVVVAKHMPVYTARIQYIAGLTVPETCSRMEALWS